MSPELRRRIFREGGRGDISFIGPGVMGSALARAQLENGLAVNVWNRSPDKLAALAGTGADTADDPGKAVSAGINHELPAFWLDRVRPARAAG